MWRATREVLIHSMTMPPSRSRPPSRAIVRAGTPVVARLVFAVVVVVAAAVTRCGVRVEDGASVGAATMVELPELARAVSDGDAVGEAVALELTVGTEGTEEESGLPAVLDETGDGEVGGWETGGAEVGTEKTGLDEPEGEAAGGEDAGAEVGGAV